MALVVFDGDDTLWSTEPLYDEARDACRSIVAAQGLDGAAWEAAERAIDVRNVAAMGLRPSRFPASCVQAYLAVGGASRTVEEAIRRTASQVFDRKAAVLPGVPAVLVHLKHTHRLVLLSKGDPEVQAKRLADSELAEVFSQVFVVDHKDERSFSAVLAADGRPASRSWSVGNSLPSDINPALKLGMRAVWIDTHVWDHERRETEPLPGVLHRVSSLLEVPRLVGAANLSAPG